MGRAGGRHSCCVLGVLGVLAGPTLPPGAELGAR